MYVAIKTNKTNLKFFKKTRNGKLITNNEKLVTMYLTNEKNMKNKYFFKKTRCRCNGKLI